MPNLVTYFPFVGRVLISVIFLVSGINKILQPKGDMNQMRSRGMPLVIPLFVVATILEVGGGLGLVIGWQARIAATALFLYLIPVTLLFHNFWSYRGDARVQQMEQFLKNLACMGGLLVLAAFGPGRLSLQR